MEGDKGILVISLDFELYWGVRDIYSRAEYGRKWLREREQIPRLLDLFRKFGVHATWATVGLLFFADRRELMAGLPDLKPGYADGRLSPYGDIESGRIGEGERDDPYSYALSLIGQIRDTPGQAIGSHTFSHFYCLEKGQTDAQFYSDLQAAVAVADRRGITLESLVLPRNQLRRKYVDRLGELGFKSYRGNPHHRLYRTGYSVSDTAWHRGMRLADSYINLTGHHTYPVNSISPRIPLDLPASFFFRTPPGPLVRLEPLRLKRLKDSMTYAAKHGQVYHLWLHPYNAAEEAGLRSMETLVRHYRELADYYGMTSMNMEELGNAVLAAAGESGEPETTGDTKEMQNIKGIHGIKQMG
ncbi:polysaccharide deacetylase family protein [Paenibacillus macerans]|uniref:polysaccharide deacetylase family protein n=1 Tax=Paenibacillus macerans TaxID=44252 RepID=UPI003D31437E